jgi:hypothetical protein
MKSEILLVPSISEKILNLYNLACMHHAEATPEIQIQGKVAIPKVSKPRKMYLWPKANTSVSPMPTDSFPISVEKWLPLLSF